MTLIKERRIRSGADSEDRVADVRFVFSFSMPVEDAVAQGMISDEFLTVLR